MWYVDVFSQKRKHSQDKKPVNLPHPTALSQQQQQQPAPPLHPPQTQHERAHATPNLLELDEVRKRTLGIAIPSPSGKIPKIDKCVPPLKERGIAKQDKRTSGYTRYDDRGQEYNKGHRR